MEKPFISIELEKRDVEKLITYRVNSPTFNKIVHNTNIIEPTKSSIDFPQLFAIPFLDEVKDLLNASLVCKDFKIKVDSHVIWYELCVEKGFTGKIKLICHASWKDVYVQLCRHAKQLQQEKQIYQRRYDGYHRSDACGMRYPVHLNPNVLSSLLKVELPAGFKQHPNESVDKVLNFSLNLIKIAKVYLDLLIEVSQSPKFSDFDFLARAIHKYIKFMYLKHKYKNAILIPTLEIEYVWVSHMLRPVNYANDCTDLFGEVIDHEMLFYSTYLINNKACFLAETKILYEKEYEEPYCDYSTIEQQQRYPIHVYNGFLGLYPNIQSLVSRHNDTVNPYSVTAPTCCPSFVVGIGDVSNTIPIDKRISLTTSDLKMDEMWITEFEKHMAEAVPMPLHTEELFDNHTPTFKIYQEMLKAYERFLFLIAKYPPEQGKYIHPTYAIDVIWHSHMIHPNTYAKEVQDWVGYMVDHEPWPETNELNSDCIITQTLWKNEF